MISKAIVGHGIRGLLNYVFQPSKAGADTSRTNSPVPTPLLTNLAGRDVREWAREIGQFRRLRPNLRKAALHLILSHDPGERRLSKEEMERAVQILLEEHDAIEAPHIAVEHDDTNHQHAHVVVCRVRPDGTVVSDSNSYPKNMKAARRIEKEFGLSLKLDVTKDGLRQKRKRIERAQRLVERTGSVQLQPQDMVKAAHAAIGTAKTDNELLQLMDAGGLAVQFRRRGSDQSANGEICGWKLRAHGTQVWLNGSSLDRGLSWPKVHKQLILNANKRPDSPAPQPIHGYWSQPDILREEAGITGARRVISSPVDLLGPPHFQAKWGVNSLVLYIRQPEDILSMVDTGSQVRFHQSDADTLRAGLRISAEKWEYFEITGPASFKKAMFQEAIAMGLSDRISNPELKIYIAKQSRQTGNVEPVTAVTTTAPKLTPTNVTVDGSMPEIPDEGKSFPVGREPDLSAQLTALRERLGLSSHVNLDSLRLATSHLQANQQVDFGLRTKSLGEKPGKPKPRGPR